MIPRKFYIALRLRRARNLIQRTDMAVIAVALACGSPSTFSHTHNLLAHPQAALRPDPDAAAGHQLDDVRWDPASVEPMRWDCDGGVLGDREPTLALGTSMLSAGRCDRAPVFDDGGSRPVAWIATHDPARAAHPRSNMRTGRVVGSSAIGADPPASFGGRAASCYGPRGP